MHMDMRGGMVQPFFNHRDDCSCPYRPQLQPVFTIDSSEVQNPVVYWVSSGDQLFISDIEGCVCNLVLESDPNRGLPPTSLTTDRQNIYWSNMQTGRIYFIDKQLDPENVFVKYYLLDDARSLRAIGKSLQPYPDTDCLIPRKGKTYSVDEIKRTSSSIRVKLPELAVHLDCEKYNLPATLYTVEITKCDNEPYSNVCEIENRRIFTTYSKDFKAEGLEPFTRYSFKVALSNYYGNKELNGAQFGPNTVIRTLAGIPSKVESVEVKPITPNLAIIQWTSSQISNADYVKYKVHWKFNRSAMQDETPDDIQFSTDDIKTNDNKNFAFLKELLPGAQYIVFIRAYPENLTEQFSESDRKSLTMYREPGNLTVTGVNSSAINITWPLTDEAIVDYKMQYTNSQILDWREVIDLVAQNFTVKFHIKDLEAKTSYIFRMLVRYVNYDDDFIWPYDGRFVFQTLGDVPTPPGTPVLVHSEDSTYQITWETSKTIELPDIVYFLEGQNGDKTVDSFGNDISNWNLVYNGTQNYWNIPETLNQKYLFRVRAESLHGSGNWSLPSSVIDLTNINRVFIVAQKHVGLIVGLCLPVIVIFIFCICYVFCREYSLNKIKVLRLLRIQKKKKKKNSCSHPIVHLK